MIRWFRRKRPTPPITPARIEGIDKATMHAWGLSPLDWADMPSMDRVWHRENLTKAPYFITHTHA